ncbi:hypothetical protein [uncultured Campylobacter sp.]|nr:hypothetical protein [uncultured Campylobacter sp.]
MRVENSFLNIESKQSKNSSLNTQGDFQKILDDSNPLIKKVGNAYALNTTGGMEEAFFVSASMWAAARDSAITDTSVARDEFALNKLSSIDRSAKADALEMMIRVLGDKNTIQHHASSSLSKAEFDSQKQETQNYLKDILAKI